jgi:OOP family OmpA-OmpF porin
LAFELGKAQLRPGVEKILFPVVEFLTDYPEARVRVSGHTCWLGSPESNLALSRQRAEAVAAYLMSQGIDGDRLLVTAEGESQPIDTNLTEEGRQSNRRVEVVQL